MQNQYLNVGVHRMVKSFSKILFSLFILGFLGCPFDVEFKITPKEDLSLKKGQQFIKMDKKVYKLHEKIKVQYLDLPGNQKDWITIVRSDAPENSYGQYFYTMGKKEGDFIFGGLAPGEYEVRVYYNWPNGGFLVQSRQKFTVK